MRAKDSVFTIKIERDLREAFVACAAQESRSASSIIRQLMRDYIASKTSQDDYRDFVQQKVEVARRVRDEGYFRPASEVEADFSEVRNGWL